MTHYTVYRGKWREVRRELRRDHGTAAALAYKLHVSTPGWTTLVVLEDGTELVFVGLSAVARRES